MWLFQRGPASFLEKPTLQLLARNTLSISHNSVLLTWASQSGQVFLPIFSRLLDAKLTNTYFRFQDQFQEVTPSSLQSSHCGHVIASFRIRLYLPLFWKRHFQKCWSQWKTVSHVLSFYFGHDFLICLRKCDFFPVLPGLNSALTMVFNLKLNIKWVPRLTSLTCPKHKVTS